jgi:phosphoribosylformylglycinamidine synthase
VDLPAERRLAELLADLAEEGRLASAHDVADGGLAVALAECAMQSGLGLDARIPGELRASSLLFGESTGRAVVSFRPEEERAILSAAERGGVSFAPLGRVGGTRLRLAAGSIAPIDEDLSDLTRLWRSAFRHAIESADLL